MVEEGEKEKEIMEARGGILLEEKEGIYVDREASSASSSFWGSPPAR
jgi:hypothetical protein